MVTRTLPGDILATGANATIPRTVELTMPDGSRRTLPMRKISEEIRDERTGKVRTPARYRTDFGGALRCKRCGGVSNSDGEMIGSAGILSVMRLDHRGLAYWTSAACSCVFGAWRNRTRKDQWGILPGLQYADKLDDVPPGLTKEEWDAMRHHHMAHEHIERTKDEEGATVETHHVWGDTYTQTVERMPDGMRERVWSKVGPWVDRRPPVYDPYPARKAMPEGE